LSHSPNTPTPATLPANSVHAREGYIVYGIIVDADTVVNAFRVVFVRYRNGKIDSTDTYTSDWVGTPKTANPITLGCDGRKVVSLGQRRDATTLIAVDLGLLPEE
jgi:hypothetical protein